MQARRMLRQVRHLKLLKSDSAERKKAIVSAPQYAESLVKSRVRSKYIGHTNLRIANA